MRYAGFASRTEVRRRLQPYFALRRLAESPLGRSGGYMALSFDAGAIKPERAFYVGLTARLGCAASELLMVADTWRDDIVDAV